MERNVLVSLGVLLACHPLVAADKPGRVGPDRVAEMVAMMAAQDADQLKQGAAILEQASKARVGLPRQGMLGIPLVGGPPPRESISPKIGAPKKSCAVTLYRKVKGFLIRRLH